MWCTGKRSNPWMMTTAAGSLHSALGYFSPFVALALDQHVETLRLQKRLWRNGIVNVMCTNSQATTKPTIANSLCSQIKENQQTNKQTKKKEKKKKTPQENEMLHVSPVNIWLVCCCCLLFMLVYRVRLVLFSVLRCIDKERERKNDTAQHSNHREISNWKKKKKNDRTAKKKVNKTPLNGK